MKHYLRFMLVLLLSTLWCVGGYSAVGDTYKLVTSADELKAGDIIAIASSESQAALGTEATGNKNNRRATVNISIKNGTFTLIDGVDELTLEGTAGKWYFLSSTKKYLTSRAKNALTYETKASANYATISISKDNDATICFPDQDRTKCIRRNGTYGFSHYDVKTGTSVQIYKKASTGTATTLTFPQKSFSFATTDDLSSFKGQTATLKAGETELTGKTIRYSKSGDAIFTSFDETTGALVLNGKTGTAIVKANFAGDDTYASSTASYTVTVDQVFVDLASLKAAIPTTANSVDDAVPFRLKLTDALVTYVNGKKAYVQDATTGVMLFENVSSGNAFGLVAGQKFTGVVDVKACWYNGMAEVTAWTPAADVVKEENVDIPVKTVTLAELNGADYSKYECVRVKVENATVSTAYSTAKKATIKQGDETYFIHGEINGLDVNKDDVCDFVGYPIYWKINSLNEHQLSVWSQDDIIVKSSVVKTTISFDPATTEYNVNNSNKDAFTAPTATVKDAEENVVEGAAITYASSKPGVATVGETDGTVTFVGFGTTVITASYAGDATHMASKNSYTINYGKVKTTMSWSAPTATANLGETSFDAPTLTLKAGDTDILAGKVITYSSSATDVAEISAEGSVKIKAEGTTVITATFAGDDTYAEASAEYTLTVTDPNKLEVTFDFTTSQYGYGYSTGLDKKGMVEEGKTIVSGDVTITNLINPTNPAQFYANDFRIYKGGKLSIEVPVGYVITCIDADLGLNGVNWSVGSVNDEGDWTGKARYIEFEIPSDGSNLKLKTLIINYSSLPTVMFNEEEANDDALLNNEKETVNVTMKRNIGTGYLNPVCFPFAMNATQITEVFGEGSKVSSMSMDMPDGNLHFDYVETMEAGMPYLVEPTKASTTIEVKNVTISKLSGEKSEAIDNNSIVYTFQGTFEPYTFKTNDGTELFLGKDNTLYMPQNVGQKMKGFRAYFTTDAKTNEFPKVVVNGQITTISSLMSGKTMTGKVYNLNGQYVGTSLEGLAKGVYVMNGQKFVVK